MNQKPEPAHIQAAIKFCSDTNNQLSHGKRVRWAEMEVIPTRYRTIVRVDWGHIRFDGVREAAIQTVNFDIDSKGEVVISRNTHV